MFILKNCVRERDKYYRDGSTENVHVIAFYLYGITPKYEKINEGIIMCARERRDGLVKGILVHLRLYSAYEKSYFFRFRVIGYLIAILSEYSQRLTKIAVQE